jgi:hypothetical protein
MSCRLNNKYEMTKGNKLLRKLKKNTTQHLILIRLMLIRLFYFILSDPMYH